VCVIDSLYIFHIKVSEKVGGAEGTKLDDDFKEMEKKVDITSRAVLDIMTKTTEYLQPNPASRARLSMISTMSKIRGQEKGPGYPQAESVTPHVFIHSFDAFSENLPT
uniref:BAR domain-containing protein n=1 Tax=Denticeps clupeoides TaxID=299321 RepID=A0AAY4CLQ9_9TELE